MYLLLYARDRYCKPQRKKEQCLFSGSSHSNEDRQENSYNFLDTRQPRAEEGKAGSKPKDRKNSFPWGCEVSELFLEG